MAILPIYSTEVKEETRYCSLKTRLGNLDRFNTEASSNAAMSTPRMLLSFDTASGRCLDRHGPPTSMVRESDGYFLQRVGVTGLCLQAMSTLWCNTFTKAG